MATLRKILTFFPSPIHQKPSHNPISAPIKRKPTSCVPCIEFCMPKISPIERPPKPQNDVDSSGQETGP